MSQEEYRTIFENTGNATVIIEEDATISLVNSQFERLSGYSREEVEGKKSWTEFVASEDLDRMKEYHRLRRSDPNSAPMSYEFRYVNRYGDVRNVSVTVGMIPGTRRSVASLADITEQKRIEEKLAANEEKYRAIVENSPNLIGIIQEGLLTYVNKTACDRLGWTYEEMTSPSFNFLEKLVSQEHRDLVRENLEKRMRGEIVSAYEVDILTRDGSKIPVLVRGEKITYCGKPADVVILIDITERKKIEEDLRYDRERFRIASESASGLVYEWDIQTHRLEWFGKIDETLGYATKEFPRTIRAWEEIIHPEDRPRVLQAVDRHLKQREPFSEEYRVRRKDGVILVWTDRGIALLDKNGIPYRMIGVCTDITNRKMAELALNRRLEFERTTARISSHFLEATEINGGVNASLREIARLSGASRAYLFLFSENGTRMSNTHEWCAEGVTPQIKNLQNLPTEYFPWWMAKLRKGEAIEIDDASKMPEGAKTEQKILLLDQDIKSLLALPLYVGTELAGFIGFDNVIGTSQWTEDDVALLRVSSKIIGDALRHKQLEDEIRNHAQILESKVHERTEEIERLNATITERLIQKISQISHISEVREKLKQSTGIENSLEVILEGAMKDLSLDVAVVFLVDKEKGEVDVKALKSSTRMNIAKTYRLDKPFVEYECMDTNASVSILVEKKLSILGTKTVHCAPIMFGNEMMGFLAAGNFDENRLDESDLSVLKLYSGLVSTIFETANLAIEPIRETMETRKSSYEIASGSSLMVEDDIDLAYEIFVDRVMSGMEGLMVTRIFPKKIREKYGLEKTPIIWLNDEKIEGQLTINNVQDLSIAISNYVAKAQKPAILIDGIEFLMSRSGFDSVYRFLQTKRSQIESTDSILVLPFFKDALDPKEARLIQREFQLFKRR